MSEDRHALLAAAARPRRATVHDAGLLSRLFAAAFTHDPVMDWIARPAPRRASALEQFFLWLLRARAIPLGEVWMSEGACAAWLPPGTDTGPGSFLDQMRSLPLFVRLCGFPRLMRGSAIAEAMDKNHPRVPHLYLAFIAVAPRLQGLGIGSVLLNATVARADELGVPAYLENSNPKNTKLYERAGFVAGKDIAPKGAPALIPMWRKKRIANCE